MSRIPFTSNDRPTLGVEVELPLIDAETLDLRNAYPQLLAGLHEDQREGVKSELMQSCLELNTSVCQTAAEARADLARKIEIVENAARAENLRLLWSATHPYSLWFDQEITPDERYFSLVEKMQDTARRIVTFGVHVHVGVDSGDKAVMLIDRLMRYLPTLLAISANSPFWVGRKTGLHSHRSQVMAALPVAGLPPVMRNWSEYSWVVNHSIATGFINTQREIWWDIRPHARFGTIEIRILDLPPSLEDVIALSALCQCLVTALSERIDEGLYQHDIHPIVVGQNKWKAARYGIEAELTDPVTRKLVPVKEQAYALRDRLQPVAQGLSCERELDHLLTMLKRPNGAEQQLALLEECGTLKGVIRRMLGEDPQPADQTPVMSASFPVCD